MFFVSHPFISRWSPGHCWDTSKSISQGLDGVSLADDNCNLWVPLRVEWHFRQITIRLISVISFRWMSLYLTDHKSILAWLVQVMAWCRQATTHYQSKCWPSFMSTNGVALDHKKLTAFGSIKLATFDWVFINSLRPSDAICRHRSGSTLAQVMACCLTEPRHYLNQFWLIISKIQLHSSDGNFTWDTAFGSIKLATFWLSIY